MTNLSTDERHRILEQVKQARQSLNTLNDQLASVRSAMEQAGDSGMADNILFIHARIGEQGKRLREIQLKLED